MEYVYVQKSKTITSEENANRVSQRVRLSRRNKSKKIGEQNQEYETQKDRKLREKDRQERRCKAVRLVGLAAQKQLANAVTACMALQRRQSERGAVKQ